MYFFQKYAIFFAILLANLHIAIGAVDKFYIVSILCLAFIQCAP